MEYVYLVAEGRHDVEFIGRFLRRLHGFTRIKKKGECLPFWQRLIPKPPAEVSELDWRIRIPAFFKTDTHSVAIGDAEGVTNIPNYTADTLMQLGASKSELTALGWFLDADFDDEPPVTFSRLAADITRARPDLALPAEPGSVSDAAPRTGAFVFPDNRVRGTVEDLLVHCAKLVYPHLAREAHSFREAVEVVGAEMPPDHISEFRKPSGKQKVEVACIANVLKPGKAVQVSIHDNEWVCESSLQHPALAELNQFLIRLLALS